MNDPPSLPDGRPRINDAWAIARSCSDMQDSLMRLARLSPLRAVALCACLLSLLGGCGQLDNHPVAWIENRTIVTVDVLAVRVGESDGALITKGLKPERGISYDRLPSNACREGQFIAKDANGVVIARSTSPVCSPSTWIIELPGASANPS